MGRQGCIFERTGCDSAVLKFSDVAEGVVENCELRHGVTGVLLLDSARVALRNSTVHQMLSGALSVGGREGKAELEVTSCVVQGTLWCSEARAPVTIMHDNTLHP